MSTCATASAWAKGALFKKGKETEMILDKLLRYTIGGLGLKK